MYPLNYSMKFIRQIILFPSSGKNNLQKCLRERKILISFWTDRDLAVVGVGCKGLFHPFCLDRTYVQRLKLAIRTKMRCQTPFPHHLERERERERMLSNSPPYVCSNVRKMRVKECAHARTRN